LLDSLSKLRAYPSVVEALPLASAVRPDFELRDLVAAVERLKSDQGNTARRVPDSVSVQAARHKWINTGRDLTRLNSREIRVLCWDSATALDPAFADGLTHHPDFRRKRIWIEGVISAYFSTWRQMRDPEKVETLLRDVIRSYGGVGEWMSRCRQHADEVFSNRAAQFLAVRTRSGSKQVQETLNEWNLSHSAGLGPAVAVAIVEDWSACFKRDAARLSGDQALQRLKELTEGLLTFPTITNEVFGKAISDVLVCDKVLVWENVQKFLKTYVLKHSRLGDPRLPINAAKWNVISAEGRRRFVSWLAQDDLLFFFDFVIPDRNDPHDRKAFWLEYLDFVEDSRVALSNSDRYRLRSQTTGALTYANITDSMDVSAFLMKFRGREEFVVVEFSKPGNAVYIHAAAEFTRVLGTLRRTEFRISSERGLKHPSRLEKFNHIQPNQKWQREVRNFLAKMGVRLR
jgi:hypothetical protein